MKARESKCGERNVYKRFKYTASTTETQEESTDRQGVRDKGKKRGKRTNRTGTDKTRGG